jgi:hypothetical protein
MATVRDTLLSFPGLSSVEAFAGKVLSDRSMDGTAEYTASERRSVNLAAADMYRFIGGLPDFTEYRLSEKYPREWYKQMAKDLYIENGEPESVVSLSRRFRAPRGHSPKGW